MIRNPVRALILGATLFCAPAAMAKVEVEAVQHKTIGRMLVAKVSEEIAPGDYEQLLRGIMANPGKFAQKVLLLDSIGGSVPEAIRMGRLVREAGFDTLVPSTGVCQGTCVYLLAAGRDKTVRGHVGIHRPPFPGGDSAQSALSPAGARYSPAAYFREMGIPGSLLEDMHRIEPSKMRVLSIQELARYRLN
ncbi:COG3904 family protein [Aquipseudomonas guryensis]|uniref:Periplasmic protein-like protein n=1 Tax=Aquipseudomonas guryensis TaxID=2759165 RepID=A0A7W4DD02_9GAMM|nr:hypothetical protein [Pseudomonas guryensis]